MIETVSALRQRNGDQPRSDLTIEQLAAESGMSVRNIRAHQARGLLTAPEVRTRVGYYGPEHLVQLRLIRDLQDDGFNLGGIKRLLDDTHGTAERLLRFKLALTPGPRTERAETLSVEGLAERSTLGGTSLSEASAMRGQIELHAEAVARAYVELFMREVWEPFQDAGSPQERWPEIEAALGRLRPLAAHALLVVFDERMGEQVEDAFGEITRRLSAARR